MKIEEAAFLKGYRATKDGDVIGVNGEKRSLYLNKKGYYEFTIRDLNSKRRRVRAHRFQAYIKFKDSIYAHGIEVRHLNGISADNSWDNISIGTRSQNSMDRPKSERIRSACNANKKYPNEMVSEMRELRLKGWTYKELMEKYGVSSKGTMSHIINKRLDL